MKTYEVKVTNSYMVEAENKDEAIKEARESFDIDIKDQHYDLPDSFSFDAKYRYGS